MLANNTARCRISLVALLAVLAGLMHPATLCMASSATVGVRVQFVNPTEITTESALLYGEISTDLTDSDTAGIDSNSTVTDTNSQLSGDTLMAASLTVAATDPRAMTITVDSVTGDTGYTLDGFQCDYDDGAVTGTCDGAGLNVASTAASATLLIDATLSVNDVDVAAATDGDFAVTLSYQ